MARDATGYCVVLACDLVYFESVCSSSVYWNYFKFFFFFFIYSETLKFRIIFFDNICYGFLLVGIHFNICPNIFYLQSLSISVWYISGCKLLIVLLIEVLSHFLIIKKWECSWCLHSISVSIPLTKAPKNQPKTINLKINKKLCSDLEISSTLSL